MRELQVKDNQGNPAGLVIFPWEEEMEPSLLKRLEVSLTSAKEEQAKFQEDVAKLAELEVGQAQAEVVRLEEEVGKLRAYFTNMTPEAYLELGRQLGYEVEMAEATEAEVADTAEAETGEPAAAVDEPPSKPEVCHSDPHDKVSYDYLPLMGVWVLRK